jgi:hypothetical protein
MAYNLGTVKAWVTSAANEIGKKFGIKTVGGYRSSGSVPGSDHPKGLALDFMTSNVSVGNALSAFVQANAKRLGVTYVIWNRKIWMAGDAASAWKSYSGPSPHTDHVHVSFQGTAPKGGAFVDTVLGGNASVLGAADLAVGVVKAAEALRDMAAPVVAVGDLAKKAMWLALPTTQVRIMSGVLGVGFLLLGVRFLVKEVH